MLSLLPCPEPACDSPAEVTDRMTIGSTGGPVEHVRTQCLRRHMFFMPAPAGYPVPEPRSEPAAVARRRSDSGLDG